jgi:mycofactocin glycosyltransferase
VRGQSAHEGPEAVHRAPPDPGFPAGVPLVLDRSTRVLDNGHLLTGGDPPRVMRLSPAGREAVNELRTVGASQEPDTRLLARRLTDAGLMHPCPQSSSSAALQVTVVIPVRDRPVELRRCLEMLGGGASSQPVIVVDDGSGDSQAVIQICNRYQAQLIRLETSRGPAAARNAAIPHADTELIAFLDSDCIPQDGWISHLVAHFTDPLVAAIAPRIVGDEENSGSVVARFSAAYSPLDLAQHPARVAPGRRVSYVPTAVLLVRRAAIATGFDRTLRYGEDVDFVWRLHDAGWRVRYDPSVLVKHPEPQALSRLLARRFRYGTSAAPLATRHPDRLAPLLITPWSAALVAAGLAGRPLSATAIAAAQVVPLARGLGPTGVPLRHAMRWPLCGAGETFLATGRVMTALTPWLLASGIACRHTRRASLGLLAGPPIVEWIRRKPSLDPVRWTALAIADNIAYGAGVWVGSIHARSVSALLPKLSTTLASQAWSLRGQGLTASLGSSHD